MNDNNIIDYIFSECLDEVLAGRATVAECLAKYPDHAIELGGLLATSVDISKAADIVPPAGARMRVRVALNERMAELAKAKASKTPFWRFGWANAVATFVLGLSLAGGGVAYAASNAMPGQALYPLKLGLEEALVGITFSDDARVELYAALNDRRVEEIVYLAGKGDSLAIIEVVSRMESNFTAAAGIKGITADASGALTSPSFGPEKSTDMTVTGGTPPPGTAQPPLTPRTGDPTTSLSPLESALNDYANNQLNVLGNAPPGASPAVQEALNRAITAVINGYEILLSMED